MQKIGIHLSYWQTSWSDPLLPIFVKAKQAGFNVGELPLLAPQSMDFHHLKTALDRADLLASCGTGLGPATDITSPDPDIRSAGLAHLKACLEGASILGSPVLGGLTYAPWGIIPESGWKKRRQRCVESLKRVAEIASANDVLLCLEVVNRFEGYLVNTVEQGLSLLDEVDSPQLKLHLDTFHMNIEEDDPAQAIRMAGERLGHFHCVANNRKAPGKGHIPWHEIKKALQDISYKGYLVAESFVNPAGEVGRGMFIWRSLAEDIDRNAGDIARFLREKVAIDV